VRGVRARGSPRAAAVGGLHGLPAMDAPWRNAATLAGTVVSTTALSAIMVASATQRGQPRPAPYPGARKEDMHLSRFLSMMDLCFLEVASADDMGVEVPILGLGVLHLTSFCCKDTRVQGVSLDAAADGEDESAPEEWAGGMRFDARVTRVETTCRAAFEWSRRPGKQTPSDDDEALALALRNSGSFEMRLGTVDKAREFLRLSLALSGRPVEVDGVRYPWPGSVKRTDCNAGIEISELSFWGSGSRSLNGLAAATMAIQGFLRSLICNQVKREFSKAVDAILKDAEALLREVPPDLEPPESPSAAGPAVDLRDAGALIFLQELVGDGISTGGLGRLLDRITGGTGRKRVRVGASGAEVVHIDLKTPVPLRMSAYLDEVSVAGLDSLVGAHVDVSDRDQFTFMLRQRRFHLATWFRADAALNAVSPEDGKPVLWKSAAGALLARFGVRLGLSNIKVGGRIGLLADKQRTDELLEGTSWYEDTCFPSMIQNLSVMRLDVRFAVDDHIWQSDIDFKDALEADFSRSINSLSRLFNKPAMRPTMSRLLRGIVAGPIRDAINDQIQDKLSQHAAAECENILGNGSVVAFALFCGLAACCVPGVFLARRTARRSPAAAAAAADRRSILYTAVAALCLIVGGLLAWPMRAAVRMHAAGRSWLMYIYALDFLESGDYMPVACAVIGLSLLFAIARLLVVMAATMATPGTPPKIANELRWASAMGAWQYGFVFFVVGPQLSSFYIKILKFGTTYMDLGAQVNNGFYVCLLGLILAEYATLAARFETLPRPTTPIAAGVRGPPVLALLGLLVCLVALVLTPWVTLWTHHYSGALNVVMRYDEHRWDQPISIASLFNVVHDRDLNRSSLFGAGDFILQAVFFVLVVLAPVAHTALALVVGSSLRSRAAVAAAVPTSQDVMLVERRPSRGRSNGSSRADPEALAQPTAQAGRRCVSSGSSGRAPAPPKAAVSPRLRRALLVMRALAGADAFAACMLLIVPDLGSQLDMMTRRPCRPLEPTLERIDVECMVLTSSVSMGLPLLLIIGLGSRLLAEVSAHAPLRSG